MITHKEAIEELKLWLQATPSAPLTVEIQELKKQILTKEEKDFMFQLLTYIKVGENKCFSPNEEAKELIESILKKLEVKNE